MFTKFCPDPLHVGEVEAGGAGGVGLLRGEAGVAVHGGHAPRAAVPPELGRGLGHLRQ